MSGLFDFHHEKSTDGAVIDGDKGSSKSRYMSPLECAWSCFVSGFHADIYHVPSDARPNASSLDVIEGTIEGIPEPSISHG